MSLAHLERLNPEQRRAVEHGVEEVGARPGRPLLVIAGAGSGKTSTLAHRVAHLVVSGADPRRILLMTFSRRAANEMIRRVERIVRAVIGQSAASVTEALSWAGTFHAIGARLLRGYADQIGLDPAFTIHDREDSADLDRALALLDELLAGAALVLQVVSRELNDAKRKLDELCTAIGETGAASEERA